jgi:hypothetical protein
MLKIICQFCRQPFDGTLIEKRNAGTDAQVVIYEGGTVWTKVGGKSMRFCNKCCVGLSNGEGPMHRSHLERGSHDHGR